MQKLAEGFKPEDIIEIIVRRRWWIIIPFCLSMIVGIYLAFTLPKIYSTETVILIQPQKVPANYVRSVVTEDIDSRISSISQEILSRTNIEKLINEFNLFSGPQYEGMYMEDKIEQVRSHISVHRIKARRKTNAFSISVEDKDPVRTMRVANALATYFIDENLKLRESQSIGTTEFFDNERETMGKRLEAVDKNLRTYRQKYMGELPEQLDANLRILDRLQMRMNERQQRLSDAKNRLVLITSGEMGLYGTDNFKTIVQLKEELANLRTKYTDKHPDVIRLENRIIKLQQQGEKSSDQIGEPSLNSATSENTTNFLAGHFRERERKKTEKEIENLEKEIANLDAKIKVYQKRVENTPKRDYELSYLNRDYYNIQKEYGSLLSKKLQAEISANMEKQQKGEQFRILDPARIPQKPISPDERKLFLIALAAGLGIGCGFVFLLEYLNTSFRSPEDIESYLGFSVFATLPLICDQKIKRRQRVNQVFSIFSITLSFILLAAFAVLTFNGIDQTMELVNRFITI